MEPKDLTRKELYDLVWSTPLSKLAITFDYSDNGLRKLCKKHEIPLPYHGYWQKVQYKKKVKKVPFIKMINDNTKIKLSYRIHNQESINHPHADRAEIRQALEEDKNLSFKVPENLINTDPLISKARLELKSNKIAVYGNNEGLVSTSSESLNIIVSKGNISRALRFMNAFIRLIKKRGHCIKFSRPNSSEKATYLVIKDEYLKIQLRETMNRIVNREDELYRNKLVPTGKLSLRYFTYSLYKEWRDSENILIEDKLLLILSYFEHEAKKLKEERIEREIRRKKEEEERKEKEKYRELRAAELNNFKTLLNTATRWHKAKYLKEFISVLEEKGFELHFKGDTINDPIKWAKEKADWYDPLIEKEDKMLKDVDRDSLELKKWY